ncbi:zinc-binding dehydrogenase [Novosphingobium beihaiensis]|uniref:Zinc-binding dehydrogenase n=1 Tax=Novosphingobium beihaiensis TaxID=2930389 RepID=A0ABT0BS64_9SPHN|nr:zinc-binding dehydrogenase [Novosphingobium beihaiensis]MCJ2187636.1 zinc-binding dehydrogenase [Novosphingobium beihaiensis]
MAETVAFPLESLELRSRAGEDATLLLTLEPVEITAPADDEVVVRVEGAPVNPSDIGLMLGAVEPEAFVPSGTGEFPALSAPIPAALFQRLRARTGQSLPVGFEGMGTVVAAGAAAQPLLGRTVAMVGSGTYARFHKLPAASCLVLPDGTPPRDGAASFVNPLTALAMTDTMRHEGHSALVHTAAASNLGQMLVRICKADGIPLVNVVRSEEQARLLRGIGAEFVCNSAAPDFDETLARAIGETGATLGFDAVGGGDLASRILSAMEKALSARQVPYSRYGSETHKQVYIYGGLDPSPTVLHKDYGMAWSVGGWLLFSYLGKIEPETVEAMKHRIVRELTTTFASGFNREIALEDLLTPAGLTAACARATGAKVLLRPNGAAA